MEFERGAFWLIPAIILLQLILLAFLLYCCAQMRAEVAYLRGKLGALINSYNIFRQSVIDKIDSCCEPGQGGGTWPPPDPPVGWP